MYLYLKDNRLLKRTPIISLSKCYRPCVGTFQGERIEPALWYKILILDSVFVDCDSRNVFWNIEKDQTLKYLHYKAQEDLTEQDVVQFFTGKDQLSTNTNGHDFDPLYELFITSSNVIYLLDSGAACASMELLKLIHKYILPKVCFREKHRSAVEDAVEQIKKRHADLRREIEAKEQSTKEKAHSLRKHRQALIHTGQFNRPQYVRTLDITFLSILLKDVQTDIDEMNGKLHEVDEHFTPLMHEQHETGGESKELVKSKEGIDEMIECLQKYIEAREQIRDTLEDKRTARNCKGDHRLYLMMHQDLKKMKRELAELVDELVKVTSVREAANLTLEDIRTDGLSYGFHKSKDTAEKEADVIEHSAKETWATLEENVNLHVNDKHGEIGSNYETFCDRIKALCEIKEKDNLKLCRPASGDETNDPKHTCEIICKEIVNHIIGMSKRLANKLTGNSDDSGLNNYLYICYERCISDELIPMLSRLFEDTYREQCLDLSRWLETQSSELETESIIEGLMLSSSASSDDRSMADLKEANPTLPADTERKEPPTGLTLQGLHNIVVNFDQSFEELLDAIKLASTNTLQLGNASDGAVGKSMYRGPPVGIGMAISTTRRSVVGHPRQRISVLTDIQRARTERRKADANRNWTTTLPVSSAHAKPSGPAKPSPEKSSPPRTSQVEARFYAAFTNFTTYLTDENTTCSLFGKLEILTKAIKYIGETLASLRPDDTNKMICSDDLLDALVMLICKLDKDTLLKLYAHLELMNCLLPDFMLSGNSHSFSLVSFTAACQHLFFSQNKQKRKDDSV